MTQLKLKYDAGADVLYGSLGKPSKALSVETEKGIVYRLDPETEEVVGFTISDFSKRCSYDYLTVSVRCSLIEPEAASAPAVESAPEVCPNCKTPIALSLTECRSCGKWLGRQAFNAAAESGASADRIERLAKFIAEKESRNCQTLDEALHHQSNWRRILPEAKEMLDAVFTERRAGVPEPTKEKP